MKIHFGCLQTVKVGMLINGKKLSENNWEKWTIIPKLLSYQPCVQSGNFENTWVLSFYRILSDDTVTEEILLPLQYIKPS